MCGYNRFSNNFKTAQSEYTLYKKKPVGHGREDDREHRKEDNRAQLTLEQLTMDELGVRTCVHRVVCALVCAYSYVCGVRMILSCYVLQGPPPPPPPPPCLGYKSCYANTECNHNKLQHTSLYYIASLQITDKKISAITNTCIKFIQSKKYINAN